MLSEAKKTEGQPTGRLPGQRLSKWGLDEGDISLIRWMLAKNPAERLRYVEGFARSIDKLKNGKKL